MKNRSMLDRRQDLLGPGFELFYRDPVHLVRGEGVWLFDADGRRYLDVYNNVAHVGHCHPHVVEALVRQVKTLNTHTRYLHENILDYAEKLTATFHEPLSVARFCCTGTEANELALRIANACTGGTGVIVTRGCYHGNSRAIAELSTRSSIGPAEHVRPITPVDSYRPMDGLEGEALADAHAAEVEQALESLQEAGIKVSVLLVDTIFSGEGLPRMPPTFMQKAVELVHAAGGLYIADEVQPGFGRTGNHMWGYDLHGVVPDIVTMGKPMGNGHPLSGLVTTAELIKDFGESTSYFNTFGGNPVSCAAGLAVLEVIEAEGLVENARVVGEYLQEGVRRLAEKHDLIGDVRGEGLFFGAELVTDRETKTPAKEEIHRVINGMRERGVLVNYTGQYSNLLKMRPPMPFSRDNADLLLTTLDEALADV